LTRKRKAIAPATRGDTLATFALSPWADDLRAIVARVKRLERKTRALAEDIDRAQWRAWDAGARAETYRRAQLTEDHARDNRAALARAFGGDE
jgi:uncharacterized protein (UPF0335 family)